MTKVSVEEFRTNLAEYMNRVRYGNERVVIRKHNRDVAMLVSTQDQDWYVDPATRMTKEEWEKGFEVFEDIKRRNAGKTSAEVEEDVARAVREVRSARRAKTKQKR